MSKVLDVGCGTEKFPGSTGIDILPLDGVDVVWNLDQTPWPFEDNSFDRILFKHAISHVSNIVDIMEEAYRIAKPNAIVEIVAPHFSADNYFTDPTHKFAVSSRSFWYFCDNLEDWKYKYSNKVSFDLQESYISFMSYDADFNNAHKERLNLHKLLGIEFLVNKFKRLYEKFFAFIMPANEVYARLKVNKPHK